MKKCPPGVICIENVTMFFMVIAILIIFYIVYSSFRVQSINQEVKQAIQTHDLREKHSATLRPSFFGGLMPSWPYTNFPNLLPPPVPGNVLLNPNVPPLRDERYLVPSLNMVPPGAVPINISTNVGAVDTAYRQVGILTPLNSSSKDSILALMGRPLFTNRDKWQYYTISNQHNNVKLPISKAGRSCTNEYGCDKIYNGDTVYIEGVNDAYKVTIYDNDVIKYLPFV
jgi:hypothetical protein